MLGYYHSSMIRTERDSPPQYAAALLFQEAETLRARVRELEGLVEGLREDLNRLRLDAGE